MTDVRAAFPRPLPPVARAAAGVAVNNPMRKLAIFMLLLFMYVAQARFLEVVYIPGLAFVLAILAFIGAALGGDVLGTAKSRIGLLLIGFTIVACATVPFSVWPGGSVNDLKDGWFKTSLVFYMLGAVLLTVRECRTAFYVMAAATATIVVLSFKFANLSTGRLSFGYGTLANPNDFASYLLVGAPFCAYAMMRAGMFMRVVWFAIVGLLLMQFMKTGSRGGMVALAVLVVYIFWKSSVMVKIAMCICLMAAIAAAPLILPRSVVDRYATILGGSSSTDDAASRQAEFAENSTESRTMLFLMSLEMTARNPLLGVGFGQFSVAAADAMKQDGKRGYYLQTHNLYTQVSSETGLIGFALYMAAIWYAVGSVRFVRKRAGVLNPDLLMMAKCLQGSWILFLSTAIFASVAYHLPVAFLLGFSYALKTAAMAELANAPAPARRAPALSSRFAAVQPAFR